MKVAVIGSKSFRNHSYLYLTMGRLQNIFYITEIISGGAIGVDHFAKIYAKSYDLPFTVMEPDWKNHGFLAMLIRNKKIVKAANIIVAFWNGESKGTKNILRQAYKAKKDCFVFFC